MRVRPEHYRAQARRSRELAKHALNKEIAVHLLQVAEEYDKLAIEAERRESKGRPVRKQIARSRALGQKRSRPREARLRRANAQWSELSGRRRLRTMWTPDCREGRPKSWSDSATP
jgi:hypothetical protein